MDPEKITVSGAMAGSTYQIDQYGWGCAVSLTGPAVCIYNAGTRSTETVKLQHQGYIPFVMAAREDGYLAAFISDPDLYQFFAEIWDYQNGIHIATVRIDRQSFSFDRWHSDFVRYGTVSSDDHADWPLFPEDPDAAALQAVRVLCCYELADDQKLNIKTPVYNGDWGGWSPMAGAGFPYESGEK